MLSGKPGGQGKYNNIYSEELVKNYRDSLIKNWKCDTMFIYIYKN